MCVRWVKVAVIRLVFIHRCQQRQRQPAGTRLVTIICVNIIIPSYRSTTLFVSAKYLLLEENSRENMEHKLEEL